MLIRGNRLKRLLGALLFVIIATKLSKDHAVAVALHIEIDILLSGPRVASPKRPIIFCIQRIIRNLIDMRDKETYTRNAVANYRTATVQGCCCCWSTKIKGPSSEDGRNSNWRRRRSRHGQCRDAFHLLARRDSRQLATTRLGLAVPLSAHRVVIWCWARDTATATRANNDQVSRGKVAQERNPFLAGFGILAKRQPIRPAITICLTTSARYLLLLLPLLRFIRGPCQRLIQERPLRLVSRHFGPLIIIAVDCVIDGVATACCCSSPAMAVNLICD